MLLKKLGPLFSQKLMTENMKDKFLKIRLVFLIGLIFLNVSCVTTFRNYQMNDVHDLAYYQWQEREPDIFYTELHADTANLRGYAFKVRQSRIKEVVISEAKENEDGFYFSPQTTHAFAKKNQLNLTINTSVYKKIDSGFLPTGIYIYDGQNFGGNADNDILSWNQLKHEFTINFFDAEIKKQDISISGFGILLDKGNIVVPREGVRQPRSVIATDSEGYVYFVVIDGRWRWHSIGATRYETALWLKKLGAEMALNLDGGGSSTLVYQDSDKWTVINKTINRQIPFAQRKVATSLGIKWD